MRKHPLAVILLVLLLWLIAALGTASSSPRTFTVNTTDDTYDGSCDPLGAGNCTLREAIDLANLNTGPDSIEFNIPEEDPGREVSGISGTWTITLTSPLPSLSGGATVISGTTQPGKLEDPNPYGPEIEITGAGLASGDCLTISSADNVIHGLVINRCPSSGIFISGSGATTNTITGNYIGSDAEGDVALANSYGVHIFGGAQNNIIGGHTEAERNLISGNDNDGVRISGSGTDGNTISGNYIGVRRSAIWAMGNGLGIGIYGGAQNTIGGATPGEMNLVSGNDNHGVVISGSGADGNTIIGNYIGTDFSGSGGLYSFYHGIYIYGGAQHNVIGGETEVERNIISGNHHDGVRVSGSGTDGNTITANYIGIDVSGSSPLGNDVYGLHIESGAQNTVIEKNVISGNDSIGVVISGGETDSNTVSGNYIGTGATGSSDVGNTLNGVLITGGAQNNVIGGDTEAKKNIISGNDAWGVHIDESGSNGNTVSGNYIGIDVTGSYTLPNAVDGVFIGPGAQFNVIGGDREAEGNVICGNGGRGVRISGVGAMSNTVSANYIGIDATGSITLPNLASGVHIFGGAQFNVVGGDTEAERNIISGNDYCGVQIDESGTDGNTVSGNYIGLDAAGTTDFGNTEYGVMVRLGAQDNVIEGNVISGNDKSGVVIYGSGADSNTVSGNYIGTDATGSSKLGNTEVGVYISTGAKYNVVGGSTPGERNVISGNSSGVYISVSGTMTNTVSGNYIGTDATGSSSLGNTGSGVLIKAGAQNSVIGGESPGERNIIAFNFVGVYVEGTGTIGHRISRNSIHSNTGLGIRNENGGNIELPPPVISPDASCMEISGTAPASATVEVFTGPDEEGKTYLAAVSADGDGNWSASGPFTLDSYVTATASDASDNTSDFSVVVAPVCYRIFLPLIVKNY